MAAYAGTWVHVAATVSMTDLTYTAAIYINGALAASSTGDLMAITCSINRVFLGCTGDCPTTYSVYETANYGNVSTTSTSTTTCLCGARPYITDGSPNYVYSSCDVPRAASYIGRSNFYPSVSDFVGSIAEVVRPPRTTPRFPA